MPHSLRATVLYAGVAIRQRMVAEEQSPDDALAYLRQGEAYYQSLDYGSANEMADEFGWDVFSSLPEERAAFQQTIDTWVRRSRPAWVGIVPLGRAKVLETLDENMRQCLTIGGLLDNDPDALRWWEALSSWARRDLADRLAALGRAAEERCLARERVLLAGTGHEPIWVAIEDNTAGYDVRSWRPGDIAEERETWRRHYIEVKSSVGGEAIHLPRSEWEFAVNHPADWELQDLGRRCEDSDRGRPRDRGHPRSE